MLIADTNEFHPLVNGAAYAAQKFPDGSSPAAVILRATYSNTHVDNAYVSSLAQARSANLMVGHYGYMTAGVDAGVQGSFFGQTVAAHGGLRAGDTIWCDCEEGSGDQEPRVTAFLAAAHAVLADPAQDEGEYSGAAFYQAHLGTTPAGLHRWIASYGTAAPADGEVLFQFTDNEAMAGVAGNCDCSIFNGTAAQYKAVFSPAPAPVPPPPSAFQIGDTMHVQPFQATTQESGFMAIAVPLPAGATKDNVVGMVLDASSAYDPQGWVTGRAYPDYEQPVAGQCRIIVEGPPNHFFTGRMYVSV